MWRSLEPPDEELARVTCYSIVASVLPPGLRRRRTRGVDRWLRAEPQGEGVGLQRRCRWFFCRPGSAATP